MSGHTRMPLSKSGTPNETVEALAAQQARQEQQIVRLEDRMTQLEASSPTVDPWVEFAGMFKDDPLFDEFIEDMAAYRRELDATVAQHEMKD
jgi:hypothetical protein